MRDMNKTVLISILLLAVQGQAGDFKDVKELALKNGFKPSNEVIKAVVKAARWYGLEPLDLAAIGLVETGLGKFNQDTYNTNGTVDTGIFQINTINRPKCVQFDLTTSEGSAMCAAKLLQQIRRKYAPKDPQWKAVYHSKTPQYKDIYARKIAQVLEKDVE